MKSTPPSSQRRGGGAIEKQIWGVKMQEKKQSEQWNSCSGWGEQNLENGGIRER